LKRAEHRLRFRWPSAAVELLGRVPDYVVRLQLRTERSAHGSGRIYTLVHRASDRTRNSVEQSVSIKVPRDRKH
jgi:hypothetical protein